VVGPKAALKKSPIAWHANTCYFHLQVLFVLPFSSIGAVSIAAVLIPSLILGTIAVYVYLRRSEIKARLAALALLKVYNII